MLKEKTARKTKPELPAAEESDEDTIHGEEDEDEEELSDEEEGYDEEVQETDAEYDLKRAEGEVVLPSEWKVRFLNSSVEDIRKFLSFIKPFERCETTGRIVATQSLTNVFEGVCQYLDSDEKIAQERIACLTKEFFSRCDILFGVTCALPKHIRAYTNENSWNNLYLFLKSCPHPKASVIPMFFKQKHHFLRNKTRNKLANSYEKLWLELMNNKIPRKLLLRFLPFIASNVLQFLKEPHKTADFFFKTFELGSSFSILSLEALFRLIVDHNFDYPNFYDKVYTLCTPTLFYTDQKKKFIELLDKFLSSSHVPLYIFAAFAKRLMQILLVAPLDAQEPVMGLVRNLITRHPGIAHLIHREVPESCPEDPYKNGEELSKSNALESSLWELRTLKRHWHTSIQKRAAFADKGLQKIESFVRFRTPDEYFAIMMSRKFGAESNSQEENYTKGQEGSDDDDEPVSKKGKENKGKFNKKHETDIMKTISTNFNAPARKFMPNGGFNFEYPDFFAV